MFLSTHTPGPLRSTSWSLPLSAIFAVYFMERFHFAATQAAVRSLCASRSFARTMWIRRLIEWSSQIRCLVLSNVWLNLHFLGVCAVHTHDCVHLCDDCVYIYLDLMSNLSLYCQAIKKSLAFYYTHAPPALRTAFLTTGLNGPKGGGGELYLLLRRVLEFWSR